MNILQALMPVVYIVILVVIVPLLVLEVMDGIREWKEPE